MNFQTMRRQRKFVLIAALAGVISMFLPWIRVSVFGYSQSINGLHGSGILVFLCFAASGVIAYLGDQTKNLATSMWTLTLIAGVIAALIVIWTIIDANGNPFGSFLSIGIYLAAVSAVGVVLAAFLFRSATDSLKGGFDTLKNEIENKMKTTSGTTTTNVTNSGNPNNSGYINTRNDAENVSATDNINTGNSADKSTPNTGNPNTNAGSDKGATPNPGTPL